MKKDWLTNISSGSLAPVILLFSQLIRKPDTVNIMQSQGESGTIWLFKNQQLILQQPWSNRFREKVTLILQYKTPNKADYREEQMSHSQTPSALFIYFIIFYHLPFKTEKTTTILTVGLTETIFERTDGIQQITWKCLQSSDIAAMLCA